MKDGMDGPLTWGERLELEALRIVAKPAVGFPWARPLAEVLRRNAERSTASPARFRRNEVMRLLSRAQPEPEAPPVDLGKAPPILIREKLIAALGPAAGAIRVHTEPAAHAVATDHHADAVTIGEHVFFRRGRFQPEEPRGFALLVHEATHAIEAQRPDVGIRRATAAGLQGEESLARARERRALGQPPPALRDRPAAIAASTTAASPSPAARPMAAASDRSEAPAGDAAPTLDVDQLRRVLYRDLLRQIRSDFERGG